MKHKKTLLCSLLLISCLILVTSMPVFAAELTEAEVQQAVDAQGKETVTGNVFIWFLCAIAFLKVSQKIDSFMASLGVNVGNTGGNMMAELLIAGRGLASSFRGHGGGSHSSSHSSSPGSAAVQSSFLSGGLAGAVGRQTERSAVNAATGYTEGPSIGNALYQSSLEKGGDFANNVISNIAQGNYGQVGSIKGDGAVSAFQSYMGIQNEDKTDHSYTNVETPCPGCRRNTRGCPRSWTTCRSRAMSWWAPAPGRTSSRCRWWTWTTTACRRPWYSCGCRTTKSP